MGHGAWRTVAASLVLLCGGTTSDPASASRVRCQETADDVPAPHAFGAGAGLDRGRIFAWSPVPSGITYRLRVFDPEGRVTWEDETHDTVSVLPASITLRPQARYFWRVEALVGSGRWASSNLMEIGVVAPEP